MKQLRSRNVSLFSLDHLMELASDWGLYTDSVSKNCTVLYTAQRELPQTPIGGPAPNPALAGC